MVLERDLGETSWKRSQRDLYQKVANNTAVEVCLIQTIAKNESDNSAIECNQKLKNTTPKLQFSKNSKPNARPRAARMIPTSPEMILNVIYHEAYLSLVL